MCCNTAVWILFGTAGNAVFAPGTKHNVREFMFVQFICSGSTPSFFALVPIQLSEDPSRTFDSHVSIKYYQLVSMASRRKPKHLVEKIPQSFFRRSLRTQPQPAPSTSVT